jgi:hypothetical protein
MLDGTMHKKPTNKTKLLCDEYRAHKRVLETFNRYSVSQNAIVVFNL